MEVDITRSNMLSKVAYDEVKEEMTITFCKGGQYLYKHVPKMIFNELIGAESAGKYFLAHVKDKFKTEKL